MGLPQTLFCSTSMGIGKTDWLRCEHLIYQFDFAFPPHYNSLKYQKDQRTMYVNPREGNTFIDRAVTSPFELHEVLLEQGSGEVNEDVLSVENDLYIVCDGATSISDAPELLATSGGQQAAAIVAEIFSENDRSLEEMVRRSNRRIHEAMGQWSIDWDDRTALWSTSFAAVRFDGDYLEWAQSGDCLIMLVYHDGAGKLLADPPGHDTATLKKWKEIGPDAEGSIHDVLASEIAAVRSAMNRDYGVLNGEQSALDFVKYGLQELSFVKDILLFSDGLWLPTESPEEPLDTAAVIELYDRGGLSGIRDKIRTLQEQDPRCCRYPRFKTFDDISAIALQRR